VRLSCIVENVLFVIRNIVNCYYCVIRIAKITNGARDSVFGREMSRATGLRQWYENIAVRRTSVQRSDNYNRGRFLRFRTSLYGTEFTVHADNLMKFTCKYAKSLFCVTISSQYASRVQPSPLTLLFITAVF
jgi:hypothetical protein